MVCGWPMGLVWEPVRNAGFRSPLPTPRPTKSHATCWQDSCIICRHIGSWEAWYRTAVLTTVCAGDIVVALIWYWRSGSHPRDAYWTCVRCGHQWRKQKKQQSKQTYNFLGAGVSRKPFAEWMHDNVMEHCAQSPNSALAWAPCSHGGGSRNRLEIEKEGG